MPDADNSRGAADCWQLVAAVASVVVVAALINFTALFERAIYDIWRDARASWLCRRRADIGREIRVRRVIFSSAV